MEYGNNDKVSKVNDRGPTYYSSQEDQEVARLKEALSRTDEEKFYFLMNLMKLQQTFRRGKIEHKQ